VYTSTREIDQVSGKSGELQNFPWIQVRVLASVGRFGSSFETSNVFHFIFRCDKNKKRVIPTTYSEAMLYLDGRRRMLREMSSHEELALCFDDIVSA